MNEHIQKYINNPNEPRNKIRYQDKNLVLITFTDDFNELIENAPKPKDSINELWIYGICKYKLEGEDLATIRNKLLCFPEFRLLSANTLIANKFLYRGENVFVILSNSYKIFYLPEVKITEYDIIEE